jgi:hypothetical protein
MPMFYGWGDPAPDLWSGYPEEDSAAYAVWVAMQDGNDPIEDDPA